MDKVLGASFGGLTAYYGATQDLVACREQWQAVAGCWYSCCTCTMMTTVARALTVTLSLFANLMSSFSEVMTSVTAGAGAVLVAIGRFGGALAWLVDKIVLPVLEDSCLDDLACQQNKKVIKFGQKDMEEEISVKLNVEMPCEGKDKEAFKLQHSAKCKKQLEEQEAKELKAKIAITVRTADFDRCDQEAEEAVKFCTMPTVEGLLSSATDDLKNFMTEELKSLPEPKANTYLMTSKDDLGAPRAKSTHTPWRSLIDYTKSRSTAGKPSGKPPKDIIQVVKPPTRSTTNAKVRDERASKNPCSSKDLNDIVQDIRDAVQSKVISKLQRSSMYLNLAMQKAFDQRNCGISFTNGKKQCLLELLAAAGIAEQAWHSPSAWGTSDCHGS